MSRSVSTADPTDGTVATASRVRPGIRVVRQQRGGEGNAVACGFAAAPGETIIMINSGRSASPAKLPRFVAALHAGADSAEGSRFASCGGKTDITPFRRPGNGILNKRVNLHARTRFNDLCYGFNVFWRDHLGVFELDVTDSTCGGEDRRIRGGGFEIETILNLREWRRRRVRPGPTPEPATAHRHSDEPAEMLR